MKTYGFGLIGCGRISKNHLESLKALPGAKLVAVADVKAEVLSAAASKYQCQGYEDYHELLANPEVEIVNICTESGLHARIAIDAMKAGKHVLVEKPMAMSLVEADAMIATAKAMGVKLGVVHQNRFNTAIVKLRQALENNQFGKLTHASAIVRWNRNDEYYLQAPWRGTWTQDGGCLMNQSIHNIDLLQWMMGPVESLFAYTATNMRKIEAEDLGMVLLKFKNGALGTIEATTTIYPKNLEETLSVFGSAGSACIGGIAVNKIETWRFESEDEAAVVAQQDKEPPNVYGFGHADIIKDFMEAITENRAPAVSGLEGRKALEIILAVYHSVKYKKEITFPLKEEFTIGLGL
ncbi:oxidoreductase [Anaerosporomusa subterranea]|uniref:Oxidoreductase n=1 Tax=Anaerosporomusa subterranea TaxID=1794912 RepID=A0A154BRC9_ANASB|nr:Gfo/Idh/MocA family oxidoreductase [Anaerosporomusa subterranea]KYZ76415.1 oxidoreductase [Anaerosporomusa subterranea]